MRQPGSIRLLVLASAVAVFLLISGCGSSGDSSVSDTPAPESSAEDTTIEDTPTEDAVDDTAAEDTADENEEEQLFPDVLDATAALDTDNTWTFSATLSSPYDTPNRYADGWRVVGPDGAVYGIRVLTHDHQSEQPFTRSHAGIEIPDDIQEVTVEGRDQISGWGGETFLVILER